MINSWQYLLLKHEISYFDVCSLSLEGDKKMNNIFTHELFIMYHANRLFESNMNFNKHIHHFNDITYFEIFLNLSDLLFGHICLWHNFSYQWYECLLKLSLTRVINYNTIPKIKINIFCSKFFGFLLVNYTLVYKIKESKETN